jgi:hypothetical protein
VLDASTSIDGGPMDDFRLYKIDHLPPDDYRGLWNILADRDVPVGAPRFHTEIAHASIGVHHEHFLHHRRHRRCRLRRRLFRAARLNRFCVPGAIVADDQECRASISMTGSEVRRRPCC